MEDDEHKAVAVALAAIPPIVAQCYRSDCHLPASMWALEGVPERRVTILSCHLHANPDLQPQPLE